MTLLSVLIAIMVFAFGMLGLASAYQSLMTAQTANQQAADTMAFGNRFWALLQANPLLLSQLGGTTVSYTSATMTGAPAALKPLLADIFTNPQTRLPTGANVAIVLGADARGNACVTAPAASVACGVKVTLTWQLSGNTLNPSRQQVFNYQVGI